MFTGIVGKKGVVADLAPKGRVWELCVSAPKLCLALGQSVAVNGVCLTVVRQSGANIFFQIQGETLRRTNLGSLKKGDCVNLEQALLATGRLDGHFVQGHVDETGALESLKKKGKDVVLKVKFPQKLANFIVPQGSIALDGVSLTVARVQANTFEAHLIPHTLKQTNLAQRQIGDTLNLEVDILGKYVYWNLKRPHGKAK